MHCAQAEGLRRVAVAGGVAANSGCAAASPGLQRARPQLYLPPLDLCTDNAAMVGLAAALLPAMAWPDYLGLDAYGSAPLLTRPEPPAPDQPAPLLTGQRRS